MRWDAIKLAATRELRHQLHLDVVCGRGETHVAAVKLMRDLFDGVSLPDSIQAYLEKGQSLGVGILEAAKDEVERRVDAWDVRAVGGLRRLVPEAFPPNLRKCQLLADYDEKGRWCIYPA